ncbi:hypothetical protein PFICI_08577 [Pestalotiopsis fici W106-1]|uniref:Uncharacterized protein n=1 Tax=Pestalotiopsis fici (strain W106-1 / CGMCC3.15140) TaxID=1229662 RepID=W3WY82_PESFW|nr:uncharacterized protein PFICI_08577 [Pestalotiopsis fici W106-1]ETS78724.1 hypothetical protein PFICI_08577 [Pestalotiopsis fici W106-1]
MSFGFGVGDFLTVIELANKIRRDFADAPDQFRQLTDEVRNLTTVLNDVLVLLDEHDLSEKQTISLREIKDSCQHVLDDIKRVAEKYSTLVPQDTTVKRRAKRVWKRFKWDPNEARDLRSRITSNITVLQSFTAARTDNTILRLEQRQGRQEYRQEVQDILDWLTPIDAAPQQADFIRRRQPGTGQWLLESLEYNKWKASKGEILFCRGIPGAGKTILSSIVVDDLQKCHDAEDVAVCYFYCNFQRQEEQRIENIVLSFVKQLAQVATTIPACLKALFDKHKAQRSRPSSKEAIESLHSISRTFSKVFCVVDALDECRTVDGCQRQLIEYLIDFCTITDAEIIATSRPIPHIEEKFKNFVSLEVLASSADIRKYIEGNIQDLPGFVSRNPTFVDEITDAIAEATRGMFLLAKLHLDSLRGKRSPRELRKTLGALARGNNAYTEAYRTTMSRICGQLPDQKELAIQALKWIVYAKRELSTIELQHALGVEVGECDFFDDNIPDLQDTIAACCGLVTVDETSAVVRLVHYTTQEFFEDQGRSYLPDAHDEIASTCVTYLSFEAFKSGPCTERRDLEERLIHFPLYDYSSRFWGFHAQYSQDVKALHYFLALPAHVEGSSQVLLAGGRYLSDIYGIPSQVTALHLAAYFGLAEYLATILQSATSIDPRDSHDRTPLSWAAEHGHEETVRLYLEMTAQIDVADKYGQTPLFHAAKKGHGRIVHLLLEKNADINTCDAKFAQTPLLYAAKNGDEEIVRLLLEKNAQIDIADKHGETPLSHAAEKGNKGIAHLLLDRNAQIDQKSRLKQTPLLLATKMGHKEIVRMLLDKNAQTDITDIFGQTPLSYAAENGNKEIAHLLLEKGCQIDATSGFGHTPLSFAARDGHTEMVRLLLEKNAQVESHNMKGYTPLSWAAEYGYKDIVRLLLDHGASIVEVKSGSSPPFLALKEAHMDILQLFIENGASVEMTDTRGYTMLAVAVEYGHRDIVEFLLNHGANVHMVTKAGETGLLLASKYGYNEIVEILLKQGAMVDAKDTGGRTPLIWAVQEGEWEVMELLLTAGADCQATDTYFRSAFTYAVIGGNVEALGSLLAASRVQPNERDFWGSTAASFAVRLGRLPVFMKIANLPGVDLLLEDSFGRTPLWWALKQNRDSMAEHIMECTQSSYPYGSSKHPRLGEPNTFIGYDKECIVCLCYLDSSHYQCNRCTEKLVRVCGECYDLGARCLSKSHSLEIGY